MKRHVILMLLICAFVKTAAPAGVVINEWWADDVAEYPTEYVELYSETGFDLDGTSLIVVDGDTQGQVSRTAYRRVILRVDFGPGEAIAPDGYYLIGSDMPPGYSPDRTFPIGGLQDGSQTIALVRTTDIAFCDAGAGCAEIDEDELTEASVASITANLLDSIAVFDGGTGDHTYFGAPVLGTNPAGYAWDAAARIPNGVDTDSPSDWATQDNYPLSISLGGSNDLLSSPGFANDAVTGACCLPDGSCAEVSAADCISAGGSYAGDDSVCGSVTCQPCQPASACICETDGQPGVDVFDLLTYLDCWFDAAGGGGGGGCP